MKAADLSPQRDAGRLIHLGAQRHHVPQPIVRHRTRRRIRLPVHRGIPRARVARRVGSGGPVMKTPYDLHVDERFGHVTVTNEAGTRIADVVDLPFDAVRIPHDSIVEVRG